MLTFVTSLRARALASNWPYHVALLDRMLASCLAQTDRDVRVVVVCHDRPALRTRDPRVHVIEVSFPPPARTFDDMTTDKVLKVSAGAEWAVSQGSRFVMYTDADDLISRRLAAYAAAHPDANGWYFSDGFSHQYGRPWMMRSPNHHLTCGTCAIVRSDLLRFGVDPGYRGGRVETLAAIGHTNYLGYLAGLGHPLEPLPFAGSIYVMHPDSVITTLPAAERSLRARLRQARRSVRRARLVRPLTPALAREFSIERTAP